MKKYNCDDLNFLIGKRSIFIVENKVNRRICGRVDYLAHEVECDTGITSLCIRIWTIDGGKKLVNDVPTYLAHQGARITEFLINRGLDVVDLPLTKRVLVARYQLSKPKKTIRIVSHCGWHDLRGDGMFLFVDGNVRRKLDESIYVNTRQDMNSGLAQAGDLKTWNAKIGRKCRGNPELQLLICAALAGPLLFHLGRDNFGFQIVGTSRKGKTNGLHVISSVYFAPRSFYSFNGTENALAAQAHRQNDTVLLVDELGEADAASLAKSIYHIGNGSGKARMGSDLRLRSIDRFRTVFIATGEKTLSDALAEIGKPVMAGQIARLIALRVDDEAGLFVNTHNAENSGDFVRMLKRRSSKFFGTLGAAWLKYLENDLEVAIERIGRRIVSATTKVQEAAEIDEMTSFEDSVLQAMAVCAAAGEQAIGKGLLSWNRGDANAAAAHCFRKWRLDHIRNKEETVDAAIAGLTKFLQSDSAGHFIALEKHAHSSRKALAGYLHSLNGEEVFLLFPAYFQTDICRKISYKKVLAGLRHRGWLVTDRGGRFTKQVRLPGSSGEKPAFYAIRAAILVSA